MVSMHCIQSTGMQSTRSLSLLLTYSALNTTAVGFLFKAHVLDFAGGNVVEVSSGVSGLVSAVMLGHRKGYGKEAFEPYNILLMTVGAAMIWVGWFGFNGGSALTAGKCTALFSAYL